MGLEEVLAVPVRERSLAPPEEGLVEVAGLPLGNVTLELLATTFK